MTKRKDHCGACRVVRELTAHRDQTAPDWGTRRQTLTFAIIIARSVCEETRELDDEEPRRR